MKLTFRVRTFHILRANILETKRGDYTITYTRLKYLQKNNVRKNINRKEISPSIQLREWKPSFMF